MPGVVQHVVVLVLVEAEVDPKAVPQAEQQFEFRVVAAFQALLDARCRPHERAAQVSLIGVQLGEQVAGPRRDLVPLGSNRRQQLLGFGIAAQRLQCPDQVHPRIGERQTAVLECGRELIRRALRIVGHHPLLASPKVRFGSLIGSGFPGQLSHAYRSPHMITGACGLKFDFIEIVNA